MGSGPCGPWGQVGLFLPGRVGRASCLGGLGGCTSPLEVCLRAPRESREVLPVGPSQRAAMITHRCTVPGTRSQGSLPVSGRLAAVLGGLTARGSRAGPSGQRHLVSSTCPWGPAHEQSHVCPEDTRAPACSVVGVLAPRASLRYLSGYTRGPSDVGLGSYFRTSETSSRRIPALRGWTGS